ncbi:hypothetical protein TNCV_2135441 [Trichonephila clavipes]|nr:hypothetical protein TNCV_2135441 [Trichonephila clavipes]
MALLLDHTLSNPVDKSTDPKRLAWCFLVRLAARRLHESNLLEYSSNAFEITSSIAIHHLSCYLAKLALNTLSNLNIPFIFLEYIGNKREFIFPKKTPKKISGKVPYRFVTSRTQKPVPLRYGNDQTFQLYLIKYQVSDFITFMTHFRIIVNGLQPPEIIDLHSETEQRIVELLTKVLPHHHPLDIPCFRAFASFEPKDVSNDY